MPVPKGHKWSPEILAKRTAAIRATITPALVARRRASLCAKTPTVAERLQSYSMPEPNSGCQLWLGSVDKSGYAQLRVDTRLRYAAHLVLELSGRARPTPKHNSCHRCDTPSCISATHLFWGTAKDNSQDAKLKGRLNFDGLVLGRLPRGKLPIAMQVCFDKQRGKHRLSIYSPRDGWRKYMGQFADRRAAYDAGKTALKNWGILT